jgi:hypothetical protein
MTTEFPLYNQITQKITVDELSEDDKIFFTDTVKNLSNMEHEIIFALIRTHQVQTNTSSRYILPYNGKHQKKGIKFDLNKLPIELQCILLEFVKLHLNTSSN